MHQSSLAPGGLCQRTLSRRGGWIRLLVGCLSVVNVPEWAREIPDPRPLVASAAPSLQVAVGQWSSNSWLDLPALIPEINLPSFPPVRPLAPHEWTHSGLSLPRPPRGRSTRMPAGEQLTTSKLGLSSDSKVHTSAGGRSSSPPTSHWCSHILAVRFDIPPTSSPSGDGASHGDPCYSGRPPSAPHPTTSWFCTLTVLAPSKKSRDGGPPTAPSSTRGHLLSPSSRIYLSDLINLQ